MYYVWIELLVNKLKWINQVFNINNWGAPYWLLANELSIHHKCTQNVNWIHQCLLPFNWNISTQKLIIWQSYLLLPYKQKHVEIFGLEGGMVGL